ncbi:SusC/RagA family TonB-linked outer membrane protein [Winogradskyella vincentii]|uniref:SusC/RagA family TonB-linked outer membrane protein n=1 Tax=Winogradskyella vincentii TaxID=2877122 RepID=A0ABS7Y599_9FLAO|nr:SusC/RagA family TonB-linked outer membrane protein [Winogradskyella vincentii]MCA0154017.1 SusC/RagA family TonB-linked outer membrane protein [Winogradskyella vincentii]
MKIKLKGFLTLLFALFIQISFAQNKTITGTITDEAGLPLPGVNIIIKGTSSGAQSDIDGKYSISASTGDTLVFSYLGFATQSIVVKDSNTINVTMAEDASVLDEVVITALGLEKKKDDDLSSTSIVKVDQLKKSGEAGVLQALSGKTSGVNITRNSGDPGAGAYIQIRGQNTILGDSSPLIVIDGAIVSNNSIGGGTAGVVQQSRLNDINQEDIESISVLKGASAAAVYGTGAANGVIVIKTKRGTRGGKKWKIDYKNTISFDQINVEWDKQGIFGQGFGGVDHLTGSGQSNTGFSYGGRIDARSGGPDTVDTTGAYFEADNGTLYYPITQKNSTAVYNKANRDAVFQTGVTLENNISFSHSGESSRTFVSVSNWNQEGIYNGASDYDRTSVRLNSDVDFSDKLTLKLSSTYVNIESNRVQTGSNLNGLYLGYLRTSPDFDIRDYKGTYFNADGVPTPNSHRGYRQQLGSSRVFNAETGTFSYNSPAYNNPLWTTSEQKNLNDVNRFIVAPEISFKVNDNITLIGRYSLDYYQDNRTNYEPAGSAGDGTNGLFFEDRITESNQNINVFATGNYNLIEDLNLGFTVGTQFFQNKYRRLSGEETNFTNPDEVFLNFGNATSQNSNVSDFTSLTRKAGGFAVLNFDYKNEFLLELTGRGEYVSSLPNAGMIFYPSASAGWNFTKYVENSNAFSFGKLRVSYGEVGIEPAPYSTETYISTGGVFSGWGDGYEGALYGNPLTQSATRGNPDLKEERIKEFEVGFDTRFLDNRLSLSATYYDRTSEDVLLELPLPSSSGFANQLVNAATISNKGVEIDLSGKIIDNADLQWNMNINYTRNVSLVEDMAGSSYFILNGFTSNSSGVAEGQPFAVLRGTAYDRDANGDFILNANGFPTASPTESFLGDPNPEWRGGLGTTVQYKGFTLSALFETSQGNDVWNGTRGVLNFFGIHPDTAVESVASQDLLNADGDLIPAGTTFRGFEQDFGGGPVAVDAAWWTGNGGGFGDVGEPFYEDASWTRLRELSLFYDIPKDIISKIGLTNAQIGITGRNLILWTDIEGFDPDNNLTGASKGRGLEYFSNPGTKSFITTIRLSF